MPFQLSIRAVTERDRSSWQHLWKCYNEFYGRHGKTALAADTVRATWERMLEKAEPMHGLVAESNGTLVGLAQFIFHRNTIHIADTCYLQDLFTSEECRGRGVARQLVEAVYRACQLQGVGSVYWHTHSTNGAARALYDKIGKNTDFLVYRAQI